MLTLFRRAWPVPVVKALVPVAILLTAAGAVAYLMMEDVLAGWTEHWRVIFGPILILLVLYARGGLARAFDRERTGG